MSVQSLRKVAICVALVAITWVVFGQTLRHDFINYDDNTYVYDNENVAKGLTFSGVVWAFTHFDNDNWHPLTSISHMIDCQIFGLQPAGHHFINVFLHAVAAVLLFLAMNRLTNAFWSSALVAAVFAIHPLRVESVAWVAERKDVLSAVFFMLTLWAYAGYARRPTVGGYAAVLIWFVLGLMSKPMLVTLPFVLLFLDYWPLRRLNDAASLRRSILEKIPLLVLSTASCVATLFAQRTGESRLEVLPLTWRTMNAAHTYVVYLWQMISPAKLAVIYPHPGRLPLLDVAGASVLLIALTLGAVVYRRRYPYLLTGWAWYIVMLLPVIGVIQVGIQGHADRYTYLSEIGVYVAIVWGIADLSLSWPFRRPLLATAAITAVAMFASRAWVQTAYWQNGETLFRRTLAVTKENDIARMGLGEFLLKQRRINEAIAEFRVVLERHPNYPDANFQLASALMQKGELDSAIEHFQRVVARGSDTVTARCALGDAFLRNGKVDDAINQYRHAFRMNPLNSNVEGTLANILLENGRGLEAVVHYRRIVKHNPSNALANFDLAVGLHRQDQLLEAITHYKKALSIQPDYPDAKYYLDEALAQERAEERARWEKP